MRRYLRMRLAVAALLCVACFRPAVAESEPNGWYYHDGPLAGSLKSDKPLPLFDGDADHLWNRLFAAFDIRKSHLAEKPGGRPLTRVEGGDVIEFLAGAARPIGRLPRPPTGCMPCSTSFIASKARNRSRSRSSGRFYSTICGRRLIISLGKISNGSGRWKLENGVTYSAASCRGRLRRWH